MMPTSTTMVAATFQFMAVPLLVARHSKSDWILESFLPIIARNGLVNQDTPKLPDLETFAKAAELSSFTGAAKELGLTQAAVSQRIHALEATLNKPLFKRQGGRVLLKRLELRRTDPSGRVASFRSGPTPNKMDTQSPPRTSIVFP
jgi:hypothetical protein